MDYPCFGIRYAEPEFNEVGLLHNIFCELNPTANAFFFHAVPCLSFQSHRWPLFPLPRTLSSYPSYPYASLLSSLPEPSVVFFLPEPSVVFVCFTSFFS